MYFVLNASWKKFGKILYKTLDFERKSMNRIIEGKQNLQNSNECVFEVFSFVMLFGIIISTYRHQNGGNFTPYSSNKEDNCSVRSSRSFFNHEKAKSLLDVDFNRINFYAMCLEKAFYITFVLSSQLGDWINSKCFKIIVKSFKP